VNPNALPGAPQYGGPEQYRGPQQYPGPQRYEAPQPQSQPQPQPQPLPRSRSRQARPGPAVLRGLTAGQVTAIFAAIFLAGVAIRLWRLGISPAWQFDEAIYWRVSENMQHGALAENPVYGQPFQPFLYQPPMYFEIESRWFDLVGASIFHARLFGVICTAVMQLLLFRLLTRLHGLRVALLAVLPVIFDGWLIYIERVSYIENALMIGVVLGFLLYARALDTPSLWRFFLAGLALGAAASFKQTGAYVIVAVVFCWLIVRRHHRGHLVLLGGALLVIAAYVSLMVVKYDPPGNPYFIHQSLVQVRRVLGLQQSGGTLTSLSGATHLLTQQYKYFLPSLIVAVCAIALALRRTWQCYRARSWAPVRQNVVLYAWLLTGVVVFGVSTLKFPQYFVLILVPAYCFFWTELARWDLDSWWRTFWPVAAAVVGLMSFLLTIPAFNVNSLQAVQTYAADRIPPRAIVVTEETVGDLINQRWCSVEVATACVGHATYAITWQTYLQSSFTEGDAAFHKLMKGATAITSFSGAAGTATVWKLRITQ
jgi:4-amino-4-deoxy-L-arabinose transferase-like glycosyltransferase